MYSTGGDEGFWLLMPVYIEHKEKLRSILKVILTAVIPTAINTASWS